MRSITRFFWFCSGAYTPLLNRVPSETHKYIGIGGTVFFTGLLASISAGYALYTVFNSWLYAVSFGLVWGVMIFNLDRFIVSSMKKRNNSWQEWKMAVPRLLFAVLLAIVISKPLELKIFEKEINRKLDEQKTVMLASSKLAVEQTFSEIGEREAQKELLRKEIKEAVDYRDNLQEEYDFERFGTKTERTSGIVGLGSNAKKKEQQLDAAQEALDRLRESHQQRLDILDDEIRVFMQARTNAVDQLKPGIEAYDGLAARLDALAALGMESKAIKTAGYFIMLLFVAVETAPVFVKLISLRGPYEDLLDLTEHRVSIYVSEETAKINAKSSYRLEQLAESLQHR